MPQFTVHRNANPRTRRSVPYLLDVQSDLLSALATRVVVPLVPADSMRPAKHLNPVFTVEEKRMVLSTAELAGVPATALGAAVTSLEHARADVIAALDFLFTGF